LIIIVLFIFIVLLNIPDIDERVKIMMNGNLFIFGFLQCKRRINGFFIKKFGENHLYIAFAYNLV